MSFLSQLFCCCARPSAEDPSAEPDEQTRLIPTTEDASPAQRHVVVDQQRMKERLAVIVRSKESKMVNLNAALPFNLHNKTIHGRIDPSSSRSGRRPSVETAESSSSVSAAAGYPEEARRPVLGVRLITRVSGPTAGRRGRSSLRGARVNACPTPRGTEGNVDGTREGDLAQSPTHEGTNGNCDAEHEVPAPEKTFKIQSVGPLSRSWGD
ncbi:hypothetical protein BV25DRAFT_1919026 [Artomyces pyxidatus]|uniref:Uncharacterized protein n=1 Tax=Artomyces pyxidatus TaxID=48021 RepID=A0ACB8SQ37_9AGAM|nr:hypothetical protein BV25DRAFT_1919026 [Artomyces pyxidatus]